MREKVLESEGRKEEEAKKWTEDEEWFLLRDVITSGPMFALECLGKQFRERKERVRDPLSFLPFFSFSTAKRSFLPTSLEWNCSGGIASD